MSVLQALALSLRQLAEPAILAVLAKSILMTLAIFGFLGVGLYVLLEWAFAQSEWLAGFEGTALLTIAIMLVAGWLLFRIVALMVVQFFADDIVRAVEARHYPRQAALARDLAWSQEMRQALRGARRAIGYNLLALPFALALLVTGIGTAVVFWLVNAVLLGRELQDMVWLRHRGDAQERAPVGAASRFALGGVVAALLMVPFVNLLAPVIGAAGATHLVHRTKMREAARG